MSGESFVEFVIALGVCFGFFQYLIPLVIVYFKSKSEAAKKKLLDEALEKKRDEEDRKIRIQRDRDIRIIEYLEVQIKELNADRLLISEFHNGGKTYTGRSRQRLSVMYEVSSRSTNSVKKEYQNIDTTMFAPLIKEADENGYARRTEVDGTPTSSMMHNISGSKTAYVFAIKDLKCRIIGLMTVSFTRGDTESLMTDEQVRQAQTIASRIAGELE